MRLATLALQVALFAPLAAPLFAQTLVPDDDVPGVLVPDGYDLRLGVGGLNYPSNITLGDNRIWVSEAGFPGVPATVKEVTLSEADMAGTGAATVILSPDMLPMGVLEAPFTDVTYRDGMIWLAHRQVGANDWVVGAISRFDPDDPTGTFETVVTNLPSTGDHSNNTIVFGADGRAYFGQGSATNSGVVGPDNADWVASAPGFREIAPVEITLNGDAFTSRVPSPPDPEGDAVTAPYRPFDSGDVDPGLVISAATPTSPQEGIVAGSGTVYSFDPAANDPTSTLRLEAWGLRNPFGLAFDADDPTRLFISNNGSDIRGQAGDPNDPLDPSTFVIQGNRPIAQDEDDLFMIEVGGDAEFFGWPDVLHDPDTGEPLGVDDDLFCQSPALTESDCPEPIFDATFRDGLTIEPAFAEVGLNVSVTGFAPSTSAAFGFEGDLFVTESGSFSPQTGAFEFTGYKVSRIDQSTGDEVDFVVNEGSTADSLLVPEKLNKPVAVAFLGDAMAIVDLGVLEPGIELFQSGTGKVWLLERRQATPVEEDAVPAGFAFRSVWPNPATHVATLSFDLAAPTDVRGEIYDVLGREVAVVSERVWPAGTHTLTVETIQFPVGVYFVRLSAGRAFLTRRFTVVRR